MSWIPREDRAPLIMALALILALVAVVLVPIILFGDEPITVTTIPCTATQER